MGGALIFRPSSLDGAPSRLPSDAGQAGPPSRPDTDGVSLSWLAGISGVLAPETRLGRSLLSGLFDAVVVAKETDGTITRRRFTAWRRLFGQAIGIRSDRLRRSLVAQGVAHGRDYAGDIPATLFALHSAVAVVAKLLAAAVVRASGGDEGPALERGGALARLRWVDSGAPFVAVGIEGMTTPDLFDWVALEPAAAGLASEIAALIEAIADRVAAAGLGRPAAPWVGDVFTALYQTVVPRELRHALGEVYTPPWLAAHALDRIGWQSRDDLLDPTCGTGTFLLEALGRRLRAASPSESAAGLLEGLFGIDVNPLAVQAAKASCVVALAGRFDRSRPVRLPVYWACALTVSEPNGGWLESGADAVAAAAIPRVSHLAGNPPWVRWSQSPPAYAAAIKAVAGPLGLLGGDRYVGGIEADLAAVVTLAALGRWLKPGGRLAFYLTASLFSTPSGRGFRRFVSPEPVGACRVLMVEDLKALAPFEGVSNHPALLLLEAGAATAYPVPYEVRMPVAGAGGAARRGYPDGAAFRAGTRVQALLARPLPGGVDGPWLKGNAEQHGLWHHLFDGAALPVYRARKGVTTDRNGIYFVSATAGTAPGLVEITNHPDLGRHPVVMGKTAVIEDEHLFPLLRGRGVAAFRARVDPVLRVLVAQRGMHGDPALPEHCPRTFAWFQGFETELRQRASYRRYQQGQPFWSVWSTGSYSFSPWKVLWREISHRFCAAYIGPVVDDVLGVRVVVPDHKLYFISAADEAEAAYLTGLLNAPSVVAAVSACAASLSLGARIVETLRIPRFCPDDERHRAVAALAMALTRGSEGVGTAEGAVLDDLARAVMGTASLNP
jgi:hypothetical protein